MTMTFKDLLKELLPPGAYDPSAPNINAELGAIAAALERLQVSSADLFDDAFPDSCADCLPDWERAYGLHPDASAQTAARVQMLLAKIRARGGLSRQYFIDLAAALGFTVTINEFVPFMAGWGRCGDTLYDPAVVNIWEVAVQASARWITPRLGTFRCGDPLGTYYSGTPMETLFIALKPAHTFVFFTYN